MRSLINYKGFTLLEVIIAASVAAVIGMLLLLIILNSTSISYTQSSRVDQGLGINDALAKIREEIKESTGVATGYPETGSSIYETSQTQLVLKVSAIDNSGSIIDGSLDYFVFLKDQDKLRLKVFPAALSQRKEVDQILTGNVNSIIFKYLDDTHPPVEVPPATAAKVQITLVLRTKIGPEYESSMATSEAILRNN